MNLGQWPFETGSDLMASIREMPSSKNSEDPPETPMNSTTTTASPFGSQLRPELSLKRRGHTGIATPIESDSTVPFESEEAGPHGPAALRAAWDKLFRARAI